MSNHYTAERNAQILLSLLKQNGIKRIIASPGTTNVAFVASAQQDHYFEMYSAADERSAAYMACGMSEESGEPVVLSCTGATASRNYYPGMTEAYYRKLPILAVTSSRQNYFIGQNFDQVTDRTQLANDVAKISIQLPIIHDGIAEWACVDRANKAIIELKRHGGGPVHINLETAYNSDFSITSIPPVRKISYYGSTDQFPCINSHEIGIVIGSHPVFDKETVTLIEQFCEKYNGVVLKDHTSNYSGKYGINCALTSVQLSYVPKTTKIKHIIHLGGITSTVFRVEPEEVWRVSPDGDVIDTFKKVNSVFEMDESFFFKYYCNKKIEAVQTALYCALNDEYRRVLNNKYDLPFSNAWIAKKYANRLPDNCVLHLGIRNSLRVWSFFDVPESVRVYSNVGGFGIDGCLSSAIGASLVNSQKLYYCILGDLAFFYDLNSVGNRHVGNNLRILLINNATGMEMKFSGFYASRIGARIDDYISASGHYGNKSPDLVRNYVESLGLKYISARTKEEFDQKAELFFNNGLLEQSIVFEVFIEPKNEDESFQILRHVESSSSNEAKNIIKKMIGEKNTQRLKKIL